MPASTNAAEPLKILLEPSAAAFDISFCSVCDNSFKIVSFVGTDENNLSERNIWSG